MTEKYGSGVGVNGNKYTNIYLHTQTFFRIFILLVILKKKTGNKKTKQNKNKTQHTHTHKRVMPKALELASVNGRKIQIGKVCQSLVDMF